jgi:hypothetical protein
VSPASVMRRHVRQPGHVSSLRMNPSMALKASDRLSSLTRRLTVATCIVGGIPPSGRWLAATSRGLALAPKQVSRPTAASKVCQHSPTGPKPIEYVVARPGRHARRLPWGALLHRMTQPACLSSPSGSEQQVWSLLLRGMRRPLVSAFHRSERPFALAGRPPVAAERPACEGRPRAVR